MAEDVFTICLRRAADLHGSTQGLASALRVPEKTLMRWMAGRAMMPMQAFSKVLEWIMEQEACDGPRPFPAQGAHEMSFRAEDLTARCGKCGGARFRTQAPPRLVDPLACTGCGELVVQRELILELAERFTERRRERAATRKRKPAVLLAPRAPAPSAVRESESS